MGSKAIAAPDGTDLLGSICGESFPARGSVRVLRDRVRNYLRRSQCRPGDRFPTDEQFVGASRLSRSTVRRALTDLQREGWICREAGRGSYVGPRVEQLDPAGPPERRSPGAPESSEAHRNNRVDSAGSSLARLALLVSNVGDTSDYWFTPELIAGIESAADANGVRTELIGQRRCDVDALSRRLASSRPDVLISTSYGPTPGLLPRDGRRLGVPLLFAGEQYPQDEVPCVAEDNRQGMALAVRALAEAGHRRVGLVINNEGHRWTLDRVQSFMETAAALGCEPDLRLIHWTDVQHEAPPSDASERRDRDEVDRLARYLREARPTAVVCGSSPVCRILSLAADELRLGVAEDLSVVTFDQNPLVDAWLGLPVTRVELPLRAMGRRLTQLARNLYEGVSVPQRTVLSYTLREGRSVDRPGAP